MLRLGKSESAFCLDIIFICRRLSHTTVMPQIAAVGDVVDTRLLDVDKHIVAQLAAIEIDGQL